MHASGRAPRGYQPCKSGERGSARGDETTAPSPLPAGAAALMLLLPATVFHLLLAVGSDSARLLALPAALPALQTLWSPRALLLCITWLGLQAALYLLPSRKVWGPAGWTRGQGTRAGERDAPLDPDHPDRGFCACRWQRAWN